MYFDMTVVKNIRGVVIIATALVEKLQTYLPAIGISRLFHLSSTSISDPTSSSDDSSSEDS